MDSGTYDGILLFLGDIALVFEGYFVFDNFSLEFDEVLGNSVKFSVFLIQFLLLLLKKHQSLRLFLVFIFQLPPKDLDLPLLKLKHFCLLVFRYWARQII